MLSAAAVEYARLRMFNDGKVLSGRHGESKVVALSVFWQIPQYLLVGLSEVNPSFDSRYGLALKLGSLPAVAGLFCSNLY